MRCVRAELDQPPEEPFVGAGVYAIYYSGNLPAYQRVSLRHGKARREVPIYVGKAIPAGARKGIFDLEIQAGTVLYGRLAEHAESIRHARNLDLLDFSCRYIVVDDIWIPLGETLLIQMSSPLWNRVIDGFGNHDPGKVDTRAKGRNGMSCIREGRGPNGSSRTGSRKMSFWLPLIRS